MPDLTAKQMGDLQGLLQRLCPSLAAALSEQIHSEVAFDLLDVRTVSLTELLARSEAVLQTLFTVTHPESSEGVFLIPEETARLFVDMMQGMSGGDPADPLSDSEVDIISAGMSGLVRGFSMGFGEFTGDHYEVESSSTHIGALTVPPVFALDGSAIEVQFAVTLPDALPLVLTGLFTNSLMIEAGAAEDGVSSAGGAHLTEDDVAAMFSQVAGDDFGMPEAHAPTLGGNTGLSGPFGEMPARSSDLQPQRGLEMILDIPLDVTVELGRVRMLIRDVLELSTGSVIELDRVAGEPVDLLVNGRLVAKGEVVVIEDNFGIRITEIVSPAERVAGIGRGDRR